MSNLVPTDSQKIDQLLSEVLEVKAALASISEVTHEHRKCLEDFGKALQDCVDVLQPPGHDLRQGVTPKQQTPQQPVTVTVQPVAQSIVQPATKMVQSVMSAPVPATAEKTGMKRIVDLKDGDKKVNVTGKVVAVKDIRKTSTSKRVTEGVLSDHTETIKLSPWDEQIDLAKEDSIISIENGYTNTYQDKLTLNIGLYGKLKVEASP